MPAALSDTGEGYGVIRPHSEPDSEVVTGRPGTSSSSNSTGASPVLTRVRLRLATWPCRTSTVTLRGTGSNRPDCSQTSSTHGLAGGHPHPGSRLGRDRRATAVSRCWPEPGVNSQ